MLNNFYINTFKIYRPSGSMTLTGDYVETGSLYLSGLGRIEPSNGLENMSKYNFYCDIIDIDIEDTLFIDDEAYNIKNIANYFDHHLQLSIDAI